MRGAPAARREASVPRLRLTRSTASRKQAQGIAGGPASPGQPDGSAERRQGATGPARVKGRSMEETQVIIVGGGPVGLTLAVDLGRRGIRCVLLEQKPAPQFLP